MLKELLLEKRRNAMKVPNSEHTSRRWRIHEVTEGFRLEDVWEPDLTFAADDFPRLIELVASLDLSKSSSPAVRALVAVRLKLGELFGWDKPRPKGTGSQGSQSAPNTLRDRLPADLRDGPRGPAVAAAPSTPLYMTDDEWAVELVNQTVHGVIHVGRVPVGDGFRAQMAIYVKPNGMLGQVYMAGIKPFRHLIVYPVMFRDAERAWRALAVGDRT
jgi:hypothetical protein